MNNHYGMANVILFKSMHIRAKPIHHDEPTPCPSYKNKKITVNHTKKNSCKKLKMVHTSSLFESMSMVGITLPLEEPTVNQL